MKSEIHNMYAQKKEVQSKTKILREKEKEFKKYLSGKCQKRNVSR